MKRPSFHAAVSLVAAVLLVAGCAAPPLRPGAIAGGPVAANAADPAIPPPPAADATRGALPDAAVRERLLALDPDHISDRDVRETLARGPTPRLILLHGGIYPVYLEMKSFGEFLVRMGYPQAQIRDPGTGDWSYSPYKDSTTLAGLVAWQYEHDGMRPMLIGHSQGGIQAVKILHELAGDFDDTLQVFDPQTGRTENRTTIIDPYTHRERPIVGLSVAYVSVVGAGGSALLLPNQWSMIDKLQSIPDTVDDFTGYFVEGDPIAWSFGWMLRGEAFHRQGTANVRNVVLPATYSHGMLPGVASLANDPEVRDWINAYVPGDGRDPSALPGIAPRHVLWAADVWYDIKRHWCLEAQNWVRARIAGYRAGGRGG